LTKCLKRQTRTGATGKGSERYDDASGKHIHAEANHNKELGGPLMKHTTSEEA
jgi:hypothetical protein